jgi:hypothetical protein
MGFQMIACGSESIGNPITWGIEAPPCATAAKTSNPSVTASEIIFRVYVLHPCSPERSLTRKRIFI